MEFFVWDYLDFVRASKSSYADFRAVQNKSGSVATFCGVHSVALKSVAWSGRHHFELLYRQKSSWEIFVRMAKICWLANTSSMPGQ